MANGLAFDPVFMLVAIIFIILIFKDWLGDLWGGGKKSGFQIKGITIKPGIEKLAEEGSLLISAVESFGNNGKWKVIYRGMELGTATAYDEKKESYFIYLPKLHKKKDVILIVDKKAVSVYAGAPGTIIINSYANFYPVAENVYYAGERALKEFKDYIETRTFLSILGDFAQTQEKFYAFFNPETASRIAEVRELVELERKKREESIARIT